MARIKNLLIDSEEFEVGKYLGLGFTNTILLKDFVSLKSTYEEKIDLLTEKQRTEYLTREEYLSLNSDTLVQLNAAQVAQPDSYVEFDIQKRKILSECPSATDYSDEIRRLQVKSELYGITPHELIPGEDYYIVGKACYEYLKSRYHLGLRNAHYGDIIKLPRLGLKDDTGLKFANWQPNSRDIKFFLSEDFKDFGKKPQIGITKDLKSSVTWLQYFTSLACPLGLDYETNDFPLREDFRATGVSIASEEFSVYISFDEMRKIGELEDFLPHYKSFLQEAQERIWVFNLSFEQRASYQYFSEFYNFYDAVVVNLIEERNSRFYSLKYTSQLLLSVNSWDDNFDLFTDRLENLFNKYGWDEFPSTSDWKFDEIIIELQDKFPAQKNEIIEVLCREWGNKFAAIPSDVLGYYCCLDAYYTLQIGLYTMRSYTSNCIDAYNGNIQLGARLQTVGIFKDTAIYDEYKGRAEKYLAWAVFHCVRYSYLKRKKELSGKTNNYNDYPEGIRRLIENEVYMDSEIDMGKTIMAVCYDEAYEFGLDENKLIQILGNQGKEEVLTRVKYYVGKYSPKAQRKRSMFHDLSNYFINNHKFPEQYRELHANTMESLRVDKYLTLWDKINYQFTSMDSVPSTIILSETEQMSAGNFYEYLIQNHLNLRAPLGFDGFLAPLHRENILVASYLALTKDIESLRQVISFDTHKTNILSDVIRYKNIMKELPNEDSVKQIFNHYIGSTYNEISWSTYDYCNLVDSVSVHYPNQYVELRQYMKEGKMEVGNLYTYLHISLCVRAFKRYHKLYSSYITGMLVNTDRAVDNFDQNWITVAKKEEIKKEDIKAIRMYPRFDVCAKSSKRWGAGIHTISSYNDVKRVITAPKDCLLSYFDISAAEIRTLAYMSKDPIMIEAFQNKEDLYIKTAKLFNPNATPEYIKSLRSDFKVVLLAYFYNQGDSSLAELMHKTVEEVRILKSQLGQAYKTAKEWSAGMVAYAKKNKGLLKTLLGDRIKIEDTYRLEQQGVNIPVQGFTAVLLAEGFNNILRQAQIHKVKIQPLIVVHDSATNMFHVEELLKLGSFYYEHFTEYLYSKYGVRYEFKTLIGTNYFDLVELVVEDKTIRMKGNNLSISQIMERLESNGILFTTESENPIVVQDYEDQETLFIQEMAKPNFRADTSYNKVTLTVTNR